MFRFFFWQWTSSAVTVPTITGVEYTLPNNKLHYTNIDDKMHYIFNEDD